MEQSRVSAAYAKAEEKKTESAKSAASRGLAMNVTKTCAEAEPTTKTVEDILTAPRNLAYIAAIEKGDEMTEEDFEIVDMVQEHIQKQQEKETKQQPDRLLHTIGKCYITGCKVHTFEKFIHYGEHVNQVDLRPISEMTPRLKKGYDVYCRHPECICVEVYEHHICVVDRSGKTTVEKDEE